MKVDNEIIPGPDAPPPALAPLTGRRVLMGRARSAPSQVAANLRNLGAQVTEVPRIEVCPLQDTTALDAALRSITADCALVFACPHSVDAVVARLAALDIGVAVPLLAIGRPAGQRLEECGLLPVVITPGHCVDALRGRFAAHRQIVFGADRPSLMEDLEALGVAAEFVAAYRIVPNFPPGLPDIPEVLVLPSSSAARRVYESSLGQALKSVPSLCIGPKTAQAARALGSTDVRTVEADTIEALTNAVVALLTEG